MQVLGVTSGQQRLQSCCYLTIYCPLYRTTAYPLPLANERGGDVIGLVLLDEDATARDLLQVRGLSRLGLGLGQGPGLANLRRGALKEDLQERGDLLTPTLTLNPNSNPNPAWPAS